MFCRADESFLWHPLGTKNLKLENNKSQFSSLVFLLLPMEGGGGGVSVVNPMSMNSYSTTFFPSHANFRDLHT